uniref:Obg-like ATPase 1 n=1 Tax=Aceria tosichella TaxID=561515 RepID=A0A6G1SL33_9ACAR
MAPKSKNPNEIDQRSLLLGRLGTSLKIGIVGVPNVGKSTFFNVLTKSSAPAENFPFCTIDPNESRVPVPDERFDYLCKYYKPASKVPAYLTVVDIAGLVRGACEGQGLGNAFLSHIKACDGIFHLCRAFEDEDVIHVEGEVNPVRDIEIINEELRLKDMEYVETHIEKMKRFVERGDKKDIKPEYDVLCKVKTVLEEKKAVRFGEWAATDIEILNRHLFITAKPMIYLINLSENDYIKKKNKWLAKIKQWIDANDPEATLIPFSGVMESKLVDMPENERKAFLEEKKNDQCLG